MTALSLSARTTRYSVPAVLSAFMPPEPSADSMHQPAATPSPQTATYTTPPSSTAA